MAWGWVSDYRIFILGWTIPLIVCLSFLVSFFPLPFFVCFYLFLSFVFLSDLSLCVCSSLSFHTFLLVQGGLRDRALQQRLQLLSSLLKQVRYILMRRRSRAGEMPPESNMLSIHTPASEHAHVMSVESYTNSGVKSSRFLLLVVILRRRTWCCLK